MEGLPFPRGSFLYGDPRSQEEEREGVLLSEGHLYFPQHRTLRMLMWRLYPGKRRNAVILT